MEVCFDCFCNVWGPHNRENLTINMETVCDECFQRGTVESADDLDQLFEI